MVQANEALTVWLWLWRGWRPVYSYANVNATCRQLRKFLTIPHRIICATDMPDGITECETYPLWNIETPIVGLEREVLNRPNCYRRLRLFSRWAAENFPGVSLSIDLDSVFVRDLAPVITDHDFRINKGRVCAYNGGMWMLRTGTRLQVWETFGRLALKKTRARGMVGSDQAWLSLTLPNEATWDRSDGIYHYSLTKPRDDLTGMRAMFCAGGVKPWHKQFAASFPRLAAFYKSFL